MIRLLNSWPGVIVSACVAGALVNVAAGDSASWLRALCGWFAIQTGLVQGFAIGRNKPTTLESAS